MNAIYDFVTGPLAWIAWIVFIGGIILRLATMYKMAKAKDTYVIAYTDFKYSMRSIINWLIPFHALGWKENPITCAVTFVFHILLVIVPVFALGHVILWETWFGITLPSLPDNVADIMTLVVIAACVFFAVRRFKLPEVRYVTGPMDWVVLIIAGMPFLTGFLAYHQVFDYQTMIIAHVLAGEIFLIAIPFTRASHMFLIWFSRAYMGSEFGKIRRSEDW